MNMPILLYCEEIRSAVLMLHGEKAHSRYFSEDAFKKLKGGNSSKTHPGMPELNDREILDEVSYTTEQIVRITGEKPEFFRPPYIS